MAIAIEIRVRVGHEDSVLCERGPTRPAHNIQSVRRVHTITEANERQVMMPTELRNLQNLQTRHGVRGRAPAQGDSN